MDPTEPDLTWDAAAPLLVPLLSSTIFLGGLPAPLVRIRVAPFVHAYAAITTGDLPRLVRPEDAGRWRRSFVELLARAVENLDAEGLVIARDEERDLLVMTAPDGLASSRMLVPDLLPALVHADAEDIAFAIPEPNCVLVTSRANEDLDRLARAAEAAFTKASEPLSPAIYVFDAHAEGAFTELPNPRATALLEVREHELQRLALEELARDQGEDLLVAPLNLVSRGDASTATAAVWARGADGLLPCADLLFVAWPDEATPGATHVLMVRREDLERALPGRLVRLASDYEPPLCAALGFPTEEELASLAEVAVATGWTDPSEQSE
ncbi:MAG: hypothetical protein U0271_29585 [Polyangiaceae bacterium]